MESWANDLAFRPSQAGKLLLLSKSMGIICSGLQLIESSIPFSGVSTILLGDFHQFPPVRMTQHTLYYASPVKRNPQLGWALYDQFDIVVKLEEQMCIRDQDWQDILQCSWMGDCTGEDIAEIKKLVLTNPLCDVPNFSESPWDNAVLVTPRNAIQMFWNEHMLDSHCRETGEAHYIFYALDSYKGQPLSWQERLTIAHMKLEQTANLPNKVDLTVGMKVMVLQNIATHVNLTNSSRGIITDIILNPDEDVVPNAKNKVYLKYPPAAILFSPFSGSNIQIPGLPKGIIPIFPSHNTFSLGGKHWITVHRHQLALTAAYVFTDYKAQGQTMECVIVDLGKPPSGGLTGFNMYIALSRSHGQSTIRLLWDFDEKLFMEHPSEDLRREDIRLSMLEKKMLERYNTGCYDLIGLHSYADTLDCSLFSFFFPSTEAHVRYRSNFKALYDTICRPHHVQYYLIGSLVYDINLRATNTTILSVRGVTIPIDLVISAMDSIRQSVVLFKPVLSPTSDPKSEFLCQSSVY